MCVRFCFRVPDPSPCSCACVTLRHCRQRSRASVTATDHKIADFTHTHLYIYVSMLSIMEDSKDSQFYQNMTVYLKTREMVSQWTKKMWWRITKFHFKYENN